jgi:hypothetical protein
MEDPPKVIESPSLSDVTQLRHRYSVPDVPEDIEDELLTHFNDPNWDFQANSSTLSISTDGVEPKRWSKSSTYMGGGSEVDTEIQDSKADFSSEATQVQCALPPLSPSFLLTHFVLQGIHRILRSGQPSRILTTRPWS